MKIKADHVDNKDDYQTYKNITTKLQKTIYFIERTDTKEWYIPSLKGTIHGATFVEKPN